jgi:glutamyl/glutaminyl-tRNA synthetase
LLSSVGRQIYLARCLGRTAPPLFLHHPLVMRTAAEKLSKSEGGTGVRELRASGLAAADVIGRAAKLVGLTEDDRPVAAADVSVLIPGLARIKAQLGVG